MLLLCLSPLLFGCSKKRRTTSADNYELLDKMHPAATPDRRAPMTNDTSQLHVRQEKFASPFCLLLLAVPGPLVCVHSISRMPFPQLPMKREIPCVPHSQILPISYSEVSCQLSSNQFLPAQLSFLSPRRVVASHR